MTSIKNISLLILLIIGFIQCSEIYEPKIDTSTKVLVVEGLISDGKGPFTVKLTEALAFNYDSLWIVKFVAGAKISVFDNHSNEFTLDEMGYGKYVLPTAFTGIVGNSYKLHIETKDGDIYESNYQKLMPPQQYDNIRPVFTSREYLNPKKQLKVATGADLLVELFKSVNGVDTLPLCRFDPIMTIQLSYPTFIKDTTNWHWENNYWQNFSVNGNDNLTSDKSLTSTPFISNYSLGFVPIKMSSYGLGADSLLNSYFYLRISHYTMNRESYRFYKSANAQLEITGKIFDPIASQLLGNMKCINHPEKKVLGLFEASSVVKRAYLVKKDQFKDFIWLEQVPFEEVPLFGLVKYKVWDNKNVPEPENNPDYDRTMPYWWFHN